MDFAPYHGGQMGTRRPELLRADSIHQANLVHPVHIVHSVHAVHGFKPLGPATNPYLFLNLGNPTGSAAYKRDRMLTVADRTGPNEASVAWFTVFRESHQYHGPC